MRYSYAIAATTSIHHVSSAEPDPFFLFVSGIDCASTRFRGTSTLPEPGAETHVAFLKAEVRLGVNSEETHAGAGRKVWKE